MDDSALLAMRFQQQPWTIRHNRGQTNASSLALALLMAHSRIRRRYRINSITSQSGDIMIEAEQIDRLLFEGLGYPRRDLSAFAGSLPR